MTKLYQDAILDAKAVRASAVANAKAALEEAFEPKIKEMFQAKLNQEEMEEISEIEEIEEQEEMEGESYEMNESDLDKIMSEIDALTQEGEEQKPLEEAEEAEEAEEESEEEEAEEESEEETEEEEDEAGEEDEVTDATKVIEITVGDLKDVLLSVMGAQAGMNSAEGPMDDMGPEGDEEAEISLDEILDELENEGAEEEYEDGGMEEGKKEDMSKLEEGTLQDIIPIISGAAGVFGTGALIAFIQNALKSAADEGSEMAKKALDVMDQAGKSSVGNAPPGMEEKEELAEAKKTIKELRQNLQEINLLNAKYLYMNKLFKTKNLNESQKVRVINALDRAKNVAEVKNAYETLKESLQVKKTDLKESIGFASQAAGVAPKKPILEESAGIERWQKLAGIK
jgi:hypothetical protein